MGKKAATEVTVREETAVVSKVNIQPVDIINRSVEVTEVSGLPAEFENAKSHAGFDPSPEWKKKGDAVFGYFVGVEEGVGPNNSRLYKLAVPRKGEEPLTIAVWGTTAIDRMFDSVFPKVSVGDKLAFIYLGEKATKKGLNPVKLFDLRVAYADGSTNSAGSR